MLACRVGPHIATNYHCIAKVARDTTNTLVSLYPLCVPHSLQALLCVPCMLGAGCPASLRRMWLLTALMCEKHRARWWEWSTPTAAPASGRRRSSRRMHSMTWLCCASKPPRSACGPSGCALLHLFLRQTLNCTKTPLHCCLLCLLCPVLQGCRRSACPAPPTAVKPCMAASKPLLPLC